MGFLTPWRQKDRGRVVVLGLDGTPYTFVQKVTEQGELPNFARLLTEGSISRMRSSYPYVSGVAWTSFMTGRNPGKHSIYGFIERRPGSYETYIPTSRDVKAETIADILSRANKRVCALGVPMSYPPRPVNGIMVGCFLSPGLDKATYPPDLAERLKAMGYKVDTDPWAARESVDRFLADFRETFAARARVILELLAEEAWDLFVAHVIDTDRLHHFMWSYYEDSHPLHRERFMDCYRQVDTFLGELSSRLRDNDELFIVSDHGSCGVRRDVFLNRWLQENGYLRLVNGGADGLEGIEQSSLAYSLDPGRIYVNLRGREPQGAVERDGQFEELISRLATELAELQDPQTGEPMIEDVLRGRDIYHGPYVEAAPDLLLMSRPGYDLKGSFDSSWVVKDSSLRGMHTFDDALLYVRGRKTVGAALSIIDVMPTLLELLRVPVPGDVDGQVCVGS